MKNNVAIDCRMINSSGIGTYIRTIVPNILDSMNNYYFHIIINKEINFLMKYKNVFIIKVHAKPYSIREQIEIRKKIPKNLCLYWSPHYINPLFLNTNYLLTIHDLYHLNKTKNILKRIYSFLYFSHIKFYNYNIIAVSNFTKNELLKFKFNPNYIKMIHNGISTNFNNLKLERRNFILTVGNLKKNKNILRLVNAFELIQEDIDLDLYIVGEYDNIRNKDSIALKKIKLNKRIHLLGVIDKKQIEKHYNHAKLYIQPSTYEGFGYPPLEAMSCGCPVLSSREGSLTEVCKDAALYFDAFDYKDIAEKIKNFMFNKNISEKLIKNARKVIDSYKLSKTIDETTNLIKSIIK